MIKPCVLFSNNEAMITTSSSLATLLNASVDGPGYGFCQFEIVIIFHIAEIKRGK